MKRNKTSLLLAVFILFLPLFSQMYEPVVQEDSPYNKLLKLRNSMKVLVDDALKKTQNARKLYDEARGEAQTQTDEILTRLQDLKTKIDEYSKLDTANKAGLKKASELHDLARKQIDELKYTEADASIQEGLENISVVPVISLKVEPQIFSPDGDGYNDVLHIYNKVFAKTNIESWALNIYQEIEKKNTNILIPVKTATGKGHPKEHMTWNGVLDDKENKVDSASTYYVELSATDARQGTGVSVKTKFKTDIFIIKTSRGLMINISSITFDYNSAVLKAKYQKIVKLLYDKLKEYPEYSITVEGHSDSSGRAAQNKKLSERRASSVAKYLVELGIEPERIKSYGLGESLPRTLDRSKIDLNRRVNFFLLKSKNDIKVYEKFIKDLNMTAEIKMKDSPVKPGQKVPAKKDRKNR